MAPCLSLSMLSHNVSAPDVAASSGYGRGRKVCARNVHHSHRKIANIPENVQEILEG